MITATPDRPAAKRRHTLRNVLIVAGAIVLSVATTLGVAAYAEYQRVSRPPTRMGRPNQPISLAHNGLAFGGMRSATALQEDFYIFTYAHPAPDRSQGLDEALPSWVPRRYFNEPRGNGDFLSILAQGWPMRAFQYWQLRDLAPDFTVASDRFSPHLRIPLRSGERMLVGLSPIWPGLIVNSLLVFPLWLALLAAPVLLIRRRRRRRGGCPNCGYDVQYLPAERCPECGTPIVRTHDAPPADPAS